MVQKFGGYTHRLTLRFLKNSNKQVEIIQKQKCIEIHEKFINKISIDAQHLEKTKKNLFEWPLDLNTLVIFDHSCASQATRYGENP